MDELQLHIYFLKFENEFLRKKGTEFQDWFVRLAGYAFGEDFEEVRPYGASGDLKCDGWRVSTGTVFQCYAPESMKLRDLIKKIDRDFDGARENWGTSMREWIFVHNDSRGLPAEAVQHFDRIRQRHENIKIELWSEPELWNLTKKLEKYDLSALLGPAPSMEVVDRLVFANLEPIIDALEQQEPNVAEQHLTPPNIEKLENNELSKSAIYLLRVGRQKSDIVQSFFHQSSDPSQGERIANAFRNRYMELRYLGLSPDKIFEHLQDYSGFKGSPERQAAALAVMMYFFDRCDIFENPEDLRNNQ